MPRSSDSPKAVKLGGGGAGLSPLFTQRVAVYKGHWARASEEQRVVREGPSWVGGVRHLGFQDLPCRFLPARLALCTLSELSQSGELFFSQTLGLSQVFTSPTALKFLKI